MSEPGVSSSPAAPKRRPKLRRYLTMSLILFAFTALGDLALRLRDPELQERLRAFGKSMSESIEALDPFVMARAFYNRLLESEYSWTPHDWSTPFNLTQARIRFRENHPACPNPDPGAFQLDPQLTEFLNRKTSILTPGLGDHGLGRVGSGSMTNALVYGTPAPTPLSETLKPYGSTGGSLDVGFPTPTTSQSFSETLRLFGMETPTPVVSTRLSSFLDATPMVSLSVVLGRSTPTPDAVGEWLRRRALSAESGGQPGASLSDPAAVATPTPFVFPPSFRDSMQPELPPCSAEESAIGAALRENPLKGVGPAQIAIGLPDALIHTAREVRRSLDAGWASAIPVLLVLICAVALVGPLAKAHPLALLTLPVVAGVIVWVLLLPIRLAAYLFPTALGAVELVAFVAAIPPVLWMIQVAFAVAQTAAIESAVDQETKPKSS